MSTKSEKLLALALDPAAAAGEVQAAAIKFIESCRQEGYRAESLLAGSPAKRMLELTREASTWRQRAEAAEAEVGKQVMRAKRLRIKNRLLTQGLNECSGAVR